MCELHRGDWLGVPVMPVRSGLPALRGSREDRTLFAGVLDAERAMFNLHRKGLPLPALQEKAQGYVDAELITQEGALKTIKVLGAERSVYRMVNEVNVPDDGGTSLPSLTHRLSAEQMVSELADREAKLKQDGTRAV